MEMYKTFLEVGCVRINQLNGVYLNGDDDDDDVEIDADSYVDHLKDVGPEKIYHLF
jgi:hypothetical protein